MTGKRERLYLDAQGVAERIGVKNHYAIRERLKAGTMPEPDTWFLKHPLWLVETIDAWRAEAGKPMRKRKVPLAAKARKGAPPPIEPDHLWEQPPRLYKPKQPKPKRGASAPEPVVESVLSDSEALEVAALVRQAGFHCTSADAHELLSVPARDLPLEPHERESLRQRLAAKWRELQASSNGASGS